MPEPQEAAAKAPTIRDLIVKYVEVRHEKQKLADKHKEEMKPFNEALAALENYFLQQMDAQGVDNVSAKGLGTIYRSHRTNASVADFDAFKAFILEHDAWHMLQGRASATAVQAYMEDTGEMVPGVNITKVTTVNVRKD